MPVINSPSVFAQIPGSTLLVVDTNYVMLAANDLWFATNGMDRSVLGKNVFEVFPDNPDEDDVGSQQDLRSSLDYVCREKLTDVMPPLRYDLPDPENPEVFVPRYWAVTNTPVLSETGFVEYILIQANEVTDSVLLAEKQRTQPGVAAELAEVEAELQRSIKESSRASRRLKEANEDMSNFVARVSHDLRAPARNISGYADLLGTHLAESEDGEVQELLAGIQRSSQRMQAQIGGLVSLNRAAHREVDLVEIDLDRLIADVVGERTEEITQLSAKVEVVGRHGHVLGDQGQLVVLLTNLLGNALKYHRPDHAPNVRIEAVPEAADDMAHLIVRDDGLGIPAQHRADVFAIFRRLHGVDDAQYPGSGVGLALCAAIVKRAGGRIWITDNTDGTGVAFHVKLPRGGPSE